CDEYAVAAVGSDGAREILVPRLRRGGSVESGQASAGLPVLRHRVPGQVRRRHREDHRARPGYGATRLGRRCARLADRETLREVPELPGNLGARTRAPGTALRVLRLGRARTLRAEQGLVQAGKSAAV